MKIITHLLISFHSVVYSAIALPVLCYSPQFLKLLMTFLFPDSDLNKTLNHLLPPLPPLFITLPLSPGVTPKALTACLKNCLLYYFTKRVPLQSSYSSCTSDSFKDVLAILFLMEVKHLVICMYKQCLMSPSIKSLAGIHLILLTFSSFEVLSEKRSNAIQCKYQEDSRKYLYTALRQFDILLPVQILFLKLGQMFLFLYILSWIHGSLLIQNHLLLFLTLQMYFIASFISKVFFFVVMIFCF